MASSLAALHSAAGGHLPHSRRQRTAALARASSLLRPPLRRRSRWVAAEFATSGAGGGKARRGVGIDVAAVAATLRDARTADDVESVVNSFLNDDNGGGEGRLMPLQVYTCVIRGLGKDNRPDAAFAVVEHLKRRGAVLNQFVYNCLLGAVKSCGEFGRIQAVLDDMEAQGVSPNIVTFNTLMSIYVQQGRVEDVLRVYADVQERGISNLEAAASPDRPAAARLSCCL